MAIIIFCLMMQAQTQGGTAIMYSLLRNICFVG